MRRTSIFVIALIIIQSSMLLSVAAVRCSAADTAGQNVVQYMESSDSAQSFIQDTEHYTIVIEELYRALRHPWGITWYRPPNRTIPNPYLLISERNGSVWIAQGEQVREITGLPNDVYQQGQGGWLDMAQGADGTVYLSYSRQSRGVNGTVIVSFELDADEVLGATKTVRARNLLTVYEMNKKVSSRLHFGGMLSIGTDDRGVQTLYLGLGERGQRHEAQNIESSHGTIVALPIPSDASASTVGQHRVLSFGHRNPQGLYFDDRRGLLYETEHGPRGGDEINIIKIDAPKLPNYGWPVVSYGKEYSTGAQVGEGTSKPGMEEPLHYWPVSPALSGLAVYYGDQFPAWQGNLIAGALKFQQLYRIVLDDSGTRVLKVEELLRQKLGRIRSVRIAENGDIYCITDENNGRVFRIRKQ